MVASANRIHRWLFAALQLRSAVAPRATVRARYAIMWLSLAGLTISSATSAGADSRARP
jgi:hypothetical protein